MLKQWLSNTVYVQVHINRMRIRHIESGREQELPASEPFTTARLLIGQFEVAQRLLKNGMAQVARSGFLAPSPVLVIHPLAQLEGGLSEVEKRVFRELALSAGAREVHLWIGDKLSDQQVLAYAKNKRYRI